MDYLIMCIGNREGGDDAVGPYVAEKLKDYFTVIDCGTTPENYTSIVKKHNPENLIIIDAVEMKLDPGEIRIVPKEKIGVMTISTHGIPISVLIGYLEQFVKNIFFIGIQPKTMSGKMTDMVKKSANKLVEIIKNNRLEEIVNLQ
jgi:hydrogenase 3 maturation protease